MTVITLFRKWCYCCCTIKANILIKLHFSLCFSNQRSSSYVSNVVIFNCRSNTTCYHLGVHVQHCGEHQDHQIAKRNTRREKQWTLYQGLYCRPPQGCLPSLTSVSTFQIINFSLLEWCNILQWHDFNFILVVD